MDLVKAGRKNNGRVKKPAHIGTEIPFGHPAHQ
jgi:hypothetical protein